MHLCCCLVLFFIFYFLGSCLLLFPPSTTSYSTSSGHGVVPGLTNLLLYVTLSPFLWAINIALQYIYIFFLLLFFFFWLDNMKVHEFYLFISSFLLRAGMQEVYLIFPFNLTENCSDTQFEGHPNEKVSLHLLSLLFSASNFSMSPIWIIYMVLFFSISSIMLIIILLYISVTALGIFFCIRVLLHFIYVLIDN